MNFCGTLLRTVVLRNHNKLDISSKPLLPRCAEMCLWNYNNNIMIMQNINFQTLLGDIV